MSEFPRDGWDEMSDAEHRETYEQTHDKLIESLEKIADMEKIIDELNRYIIILNKAMRRGR